MAARELSYHALDLVSSKTETRHGSEGGSKGAGSYNPGVCETLPWNNQPSERKWVGKWLPITQKNASSSSIFFFSFKTNL